MSHVVREAFDEKEVHPKDIHPVYYGVELSLARQCRWKWDNTHDLNLLCPGVARWRNVGTSERHIVVDDKTISTYSLGFYEVCMQSIRRWWQD